MFVRIVGVKKGYAVLFPKIKSLMLCVNFLLCWWNCYHHIEIWQLVSFLHEFQILSRVFLGFMINANVNIKQALYIKTMSVYYWSTAKFQEQYWKISYIFDLLGHDPYQDPDTNYNILHDKLMKLEDPHPHHMFDKHKHEGNEWFTKGIIKSIRYNISFTRHSGAQHSWTLHTQWWHMFILHTIKY